MYLYKYSYTVNVNNLMGLYRIIKNVIIYCKYVLKFSVFEVIYFVFL